MTIGCLGLKEEIEESRLGEESLEDGSDDIDSGETGLPNGDTLYTSESKTIKI